MSDEESELLMGEAESNRGRRGLKAASIGLAVIIVIVLVGGCNFLPAGLGKYQTAGNSLKAKNLPTRDDTARIQAMIDRIPDSGGEVSLPAGTYFVDAVQSIRLKSNVVLKMTPDTILKAIPNKAEVYAVLLLADVQNVKVYGGVIHGEREDHFGSGGEWGMGIRISGSKDILIQDTVANNCWGDGFYIAASSKGVPSENVQLIDVKANNNRRQGISLISGKNIKIVRPHLTNTSGTPPAAGLDIEPNRPTDRIENIEIIDAFTAGNAEGIVVSLQKLHGSKNPVSIRVKNHQDDGSGRGMLISSNDAVVPGILNVEDSHWRNAKKNGLSIQNHDHRSFAIHIIRPRVVDSNRSGSTSAATGSAIAIYHFVGKTGIIGNISILQPTITDQGGKIRTLSPFYIANSLGQDIVNMLITDPVIEGEFSNSRIAETLRPFIKYTRE